MGNLFIALALYQICTVNNNVSPLTSTSASLIVGDEVLSGLLMYVLNISQGHKHWT